MLSKMARPKEDEIKPIQNTNYSKMKLNELKQVLRQFGIKISGNKPELLERIQTYTKQTEHALKIQCVVRGHFARLWIRLKKGTKSPCMNDADFYTLEPINEIPFYYYIHYTEEKTKTSYTFNIISLCTMITKSGKFENPYTRENMKNTYSPTLRQIIMLTTILFPENPIVGEIRNTIAHDKLPTQIQSIEPINIERRVTELFIAIDTLGNYTQKEWFMNLTNMQVCNLVLRVNSLWLTTNNETKQKICPIGSPFSIQNTGVQRMSIERNLDDNRLIAIRIAEVLVRGGINNEYKVMGTMFFLTGLTTVSYPARMQIPWLYDNYNYQVARL
jgi:hypothetical protein